MTKRIQFVLLPVLICVVLVALVSGRAAFGQALPAAEASPVSTGFALPTSLGSLQYAVSASQNLIWGYYGNSGAAYTTNLTGDVAYLSNSKQYPFSLVFAGGHSFSESGQASYSYLNLGFSQVANVGRWNIILSDNISYLPGTPTSGLAGVPGVGDLGVNPVQIGGDAGQGVLTNFSNRISNVVAGSVQRQITGKTSINASGSYTLLRFIDETNGSANASNAGLDSSTASGGAGISHQMNARNSLGVNYAYSNFVYSGNDFGVSTPNFVSQTASGVYTHQFTRKLSMSAAAGPQWTTVGSSGGNLLSAFADVSLTYNAKSYGTTLFYTRSTNSGFGALAGAISDSATFGFSRKFAVVWNVSLNSNYTHTSTLGLGSVAPYSVNTAVEGLQISRAIARNLSGYASYTFEDQSSSGSKAIDVFSGISQVVGFGLTYSPTSLRLGHQ
ncbi:MAG TPA: hypothetical protein VGN01_00200 [Acidobacteriaceae bacterium]